MLAGMAIGGLVGYGLWRLVRSASWRNTWAEAGAFDCPTRGAEPEQSIAEDPVDEASWESFPASDPPSFSRPRHGKSVR